MSAEYAKEGAHTARVVAEVRRAPVWVVRTAPVAEARTASVAEVRMAPLEVAPVRTARDAKV